MANQDAAFGMRPVGRIGGMPFTGGQSRYRIAQIMEHQSFKVTW